MIEEQVLRSEKTMEKLDKILEKGKYNINI